jgi:hypothetical protein
MNSTKRIFIAVILTGLVTLAVSGQTQRVPKKRSSEEILNSQVGNCLAHFANEDPDECVHIRHVTIQDLLNDSLAWLTIPVGMALPPNDAGRTRLDFNPSSLFVRDVLDSIVRSDQRYEWNLEGGVINLLPKSDSPQLLDVRVAEFKKSANVGNLFRALENTPEVRQRAVELGFSVETPKPISDDPNGFIIGPVDSSRFDINCRNCSVREVLNEIARQSGRSWMYRENNNEGKKTYRFSYISSE